MTILCPQPNGYDIFARCDERCKSERCDDIILTTACVDWHTSAEHAESLHDFCEKAASRPDGCKVCQEYLKIYTEIQSGRTPQRICQECHALFELNTENPYGGVLYAEEVGSIYFECDSCFILESDMDERSF